jgi:hypothetical protein
VFRDIVVYQTKPEPLYLNQIISLQKKVQFLEEKREGNVRGGDKLDLLETSFTSPLLPFLSGVDVVAAPDDTEAYSKAAEGQS